MISADSHLEVSPEDWRHRVPPELQERAPRRVVMQGGGDAILVEGSPLLIAGTNLCGIPYEQYRPSGVRYQDSVGAGPPEQRLLEQDRDGVSAEVLFPGLGASLTSWRRIANPDVYLAMIRAYNDWLALDYCSVAPNRLVGVALIPETGIADAIDELRRVARMGLRAVVLNAFPGGKSYPSNEDDGFYRQALDLGTAITIHVNFGIPLHWAFVRNRRRHRTGISISGQPTGLGCRSPRYGPSLRWAWNQGRPERGATRNARRV